MKGKVYLIGAGPGDPELLTIKAHRVLSEADVVLYDDLVSPEIVRLAPASAHIENVGKRCGKAHVSQAEIHTKMIAFANHGLDVLRLKGGDPLLFGRAGEEIEALREAGVNFEIVPGVTAAFGAAAAAGIPLTDRRSASRLVFLTNHRCTGTNVSFDASIGSGNVTAVVYMPGANYRELSQRLIGSSFPPHTPCLVVSRATSGEQRILSSTLASLADAESLPAPSVVIVGDVAGSYRGDGKREAEATGDITSTVDETVSPLP
jgi:uroporphyrin-III C-methyltransferase